MREELLVVKDLNVHFFTYSGVVEALDCVSFHMKRGETLGLVGESGCGKSVTSLSIMKLIPPPGRTVAGEIIFDGEDLVQKTEAEMREVRGRKIAMVFQDPTSSLNPLLSIGYQVSEPFVYHRSMEKAEAESAAIGLLESVGIPAPSRRMKDHPHEFSGGMRQRIMIAMALACNPSMIIADEPTTNLDVTIQAQLIELMKTLQKEHGTSLLWITHNLGVIAEVCDRVAIMYAGTIVESADTQTILSRPAHPYTRMLIECVPSPSRRKGRLAVIPGAVPNLVNPPSGCRFHPRCPESHEICRMKKPEHVELNGEHTVSCWLYHDVVDGRAIRSAY
jgi:oligopeptide/dipeptide ABC transporter ATP-binding protein